MIIAARVGKGKELRELISKENRIVQLGLERSHIYRDFIKHDKHYPIMTP